MLIEGKQPEQQVIAELCHQINSPLAAVRSALYLSAAHSQDPDLLRYLRLANAEISSIFSIVREARITLEAEGEEVCAGSGSGQRLRQQATAGSQPGESRRRRALGRAVPGMKRQP